MMNRLFLLLITFSIFACASAQPKKNKNQESPAEKYIEDANLEFFKPEGDKQKGLAIIAKGIRKDSMSANAWQTQAYMQYLLKDYKAALISYNKVISIDPESMAPYYFIGVSQRMLMQFDEAKISLNKYLNAPMKRSRDLEEDAKNIIKNIDVTKKLYNNPVEFKPQNLGPNVNTTDNEYWPGLTLDGKYFYFTRMKYDKYGPYEDFYRSTVSDTIYEPSVRLPEPVNTNKDEGTISITADGKIIFFSARDKVNKQGIPMGLGGFDIYFSGYNNGVWSSPVNLGAPVNSENWDVQPSISPDGLTLYFASKRPGGFGGSDIYMSVFKDGRFQPPVNLGPKINTAGEEQAPFIHYDNNTLYYSSGGLPGVGGLDIFVTKKGEDGKFGTPENIGYPINTEKDELGLIVDRFGKFGYLSSERNGGFGGLDIYKFELPEGLKPDAVSYVQGVVFDDVTKEKLVAKVELTNLTTGKVIANIESQKGSGEFFIVLKSNQDYMLTVDQTNYLFYSANFALKEHNSLEPYKLEIPLKKPVANGSDVTLSNVFFDVDRFDLKPESKYELEKLVLLLKKFPFMKIEIGGHTDNTGDKAKNKALSQNRAKAVKDYLVNAGIDGTRLTAVGYGDIKPVADNKTEEGRAQNRRTVFKVLSVQ